MRFKLQYFLFLCLPIGLVFIVLACSKDDDKELVRVFPDFETENVIVVVVDGPRFGETWGDPNARYIPRMKFDMASKGIVNDNFYNFGVTRTIPGHTAILTGIYEDIDNNGREFPSKPSFLQYWIEAEQANPFKAWIVSSKRKIGSLGNSIDLNWRNSYMPKADALTRNDLQTFEAIKGALTSFQPKMVFINLSGPDREGHAGNWTGYLDAIKETDSLVFELQNFIDADAHYSGKTTLIVTNDHGRHLDQIADGFISHGDQCSGCTHINFYAYGPDFKENLIISTPREQIDIAPTIAYLMGFEMPQGDGDIMHELFK